jgi:hypothetical protein
VYKIVPGECKSIDFSAVGEWRKEQLLKITEGYKPKNIYNADETGLSFRLPPVGTSHNANRLLPPVQKSRQHLYPTYY